MSCPGDGGGGLKGGKSFWVWGRGWIWGQHRRVRGWPGGNLRDFCPPNYIDSEPESLGLALECERREDGENLVAGLFSLGPGFCFLFHHDHSAPTSSG